MSKKYLSYLIESKKVVLIFFGIIFFALTMTPLITDAGSDWLYTSFHFAFVYGTVLTYVLPILHYNFVHSRKSVDMYFSIPVERKKMAITTILMEFVYIFGLFFLITTIAALIYSSNGLSWKMFLFVQLHAALTYFALLAFHSALFLIANNTFDGIVMIFVYTLLPFVIELTLSSVGNILTASNYYELGVDQYVYCLSPIWIGFANLTPLATAVTNEPWSQFVGYYEISLCVIAVISCYLIDLNFVKRKAERAEQISDHPLSYPFIVHLYLLLGLLFVGAEAVQIDHYSTVILYLIGFMIYVISMFVYRRKIAINVKVIARFAGMMIATLAICFIGWKSRGFGIAYQFTIPKEGNIVYSYSGHLDENTDDYDFFYFDAEIQFDLSIPVTEIDQYQEVYDILNQYRIDCIDEYYDGVGSVQYSILNINFRNSNQYVTRSYSNTLRLTDEELLTISKYTDVWISVYEEDEYKEYKYSDYLEEYQS